MPVTPLDFVSCWQCQYNEQKHPCCNLDGSFSVERLAAGYAAICRKSMKDLPQSETWPFDCMEDQVSGAPELALKCIQATLSLLETELEIATLAAGPLENLVQKHGARMIAAIELIAKDNPRFRKLLSGIWGQRHVDPEVWRRVQVAVQSGPWIDSENSDPRTPQGSARAVPSPRGGNASRKHR